LSDETNDNIAWYDSPLGTLELKASDKGIASVLFSGNNKTTPAKNLFLKKCMEQLDEYFSKKRTSFDLPLDTEGTTFQQNVWRELIKIPFGRTVSYLHIAKALGDEGAVRAVGAANGKNKIAIIIPCHRVIGADGSIVGYAGGVDRKQWLLDFEKNITQPKLF
jgi:methylated-DNA-[protein]-cysteine S-methyltransferase